MVGSGSRHALSLKICVSFYHLIASGLWHLSAWKKNDTSAPSSSRKEQTCSWSTWSSIQLNKYHECLNLSYRPNCRTRVRRIVLVPEGVDDLWFAAGLPISRDLIHGSSWLHWWTSDSHASGFDSDDPSWGSIKMRSKMWLVLSWWAKVKSWKVLVLCNLPPQDRLRIELESAFQFQYTWE